MTRVVAAVYERGSFRPLDAVDLPEGQPVELSYQPMALTPEEAETQLQAWRAVYEGLTEEEIAEVEAIALDRGHFVRERPDEDRGD